MEEVDLTLNQTIYDIKYKTRKDFNRAILKNGRMNNLNLLTLDLSYADFENTDLGNTIFCQTDESQVHINIGNTSKPNTHSKNQDVLSLLGSSSVRLTVGNVTTHLEDTDIYEANLAHTNMMNARFTPRQILGTNSVRGLKVDKETLLKNKFTEDDMRKLKTKAVENYKSFFNSCDDSQELEKELDLLRLEKNNVLKIKTEFSDSYGNTEAYNIVLQAGESKLRKLSSNSGTPLSKNPNRFDYSAVSTGSKDNEVYQPQDDKGCCKLF